MQDGTGCVRHAAPAGSTHGHGSVDGDPRSGYVRAVVGEVHSHKLTDDADASSLVKHVSKLRSIMLDDERAYVRKLGLQTMSNLPPAAMAPHGSTVLRMLGDHVKFVRQSAMLGLEEIRVRAAAAEGVPRHRCGSDEAGEAGAPLALAGGAHPPRVGRRDEDDQWSVITAATRVAEVQSRSSRPGWCIAPGRCRD